MPIDQVSWADATSAIIANDPRIVLDLSPIAESRINKDK